jgi:hypothetical protein
MTTRDDEQRRGYADQAAWLAGKSIPEARQALAARNATAEANDYNGGGNRATYEYISRMESFIKDQERSRRDIWLVAATTCGTKFLAGDDSP